MSEPSFNLGMEPFLQLSEFSSSGDESLLMVNHDFSNIPENENEENPRFAITTSQERDKLLNESEAPGTKRATKGAVKTFKGIFII